MLHNLIPELVEAIRAEFQHRSPATACESTTYRLKRRATSVSELRGAPPWVSKRTSSGQASRMLTIAARSSN